MLAIRGDGEQPRSRRRQVIANALISYNWPKGHPRGESLGRFANALFGKYETLLEGGYHESWAEIDLSLGIPGLPRHWSAEEALASFTQ